MFQLHGRILDGEKGSAAVADDPRQGFDDAARLDMVDDLAATPVTVHLRCATSGDAGGEESKTTKIALAELHEPRHAACGERMGIIESFAAGV